MEKILGGTQFKAESTFLPLVSHPRLEQLQWKRLTVLLASLEASCGLPCHCPAKLINHHLTFHNKYLTKLYICLSKSSAYTYLLDKIINTGKEENVTYPSNEGSSMMVSI